MEQRSHKFKAESFDAAYRQMVEALGKDAIVVNTAEVTEGGILGFLGQRMIELTAQVKPAPRPPLSRPRSLAEKKYQLYGGIGSDEYINETISHFRQLASEKPALKPKGNAVPRQETVFPAPAPTQAPIIPLKPQPGGGSIEDLQSEIREMREMLKSMMAEGPSAGLPNEFAPHYNRLIEQGVTRTLAAGLVASVLRGSDPAIVRNPRVFLARLQMEIQKRVSVTGGLHLADGHRKVVVIVGATGVGKTTNLAKLAALFSVRERARVALVTTDTYRIAAPEQLRVYANIIGLPMEIVNDAAELKRALVDLRNHDLVLVDTAGGSQFNLAQIEELRGMLEAAQPDEVLLVLGANTQIEDLRTAVANFRTLRPTALMFSKLDETRRYGALFSIVAEAGLPLSYFSTGQNVPDDIELASAGKVARLLIEDGGYRVGSGT